MYVPLRSHVLAAAAVLGSITIAVSATSGAVASAPAAPVRLPGVASAGPVGSGASSGWVRVEPACDAPQAGQVSCLALRVVPAAAGAKNAVRAVRGVVARGPAGGYTPAELARAYAFDPAKGGSTQTVAVVDAYDDPHALADLNVFDKHYGLPKETARSFAKVNQNGHSTGLPAANVGWAGEISLDLQAVRAVCHKCKILLVEATSATSANLAASVNRAVTMGATEVSNSYGGAETDAASRSKAVVNAFDHPGVVITASTGDSGWYDWDLANSGGVSSDTAQFPSSLPTVVAVGGTTLSVHSDGTRNRETVWNENGTEDQSTNSGASGGGCSTVYAAPSWQSGVAGYSRTGCGKKRQSGDIAALADPYTGFDIYDSYGYSGSARWMTVGGTSLSSPIVAAMWALAGGSGGVRYPAQSLYRNLSKHGSTLFDVVSGGNGFCGGDTPKHCSDFVSDATGNSTGNPNELGAGLLDCSFKATGDSIIKNHNQCNAAKGYDGASGVGVPRGLGAFKHSS